MIEITSLHVYPLKGGRAVDVADVVLDRFGPQGDRRWLVADPAGNQITQREIARLCQVVALPATGGLRLEAPGVAALLVPIPPTTAERRAVRVWGHQIGALFAGTAAEVWFTQLFGTPCQLVYCPDDSDRRTDPDYDPIGGAVSFADGYPILIIGEASLAELNGRLAAPVSMTRFRPNIVVAGSAPFAEDGWTKFSIGPVEFAAVKPCARCVVPTTDQLTAERGPEPLRTLAAYRKVGSAVMFGMNVVHRSSGRIRIGDQIEVER